MFLHTDYATPAELTGYSRAALGDLQINQFSLARWVPNREIDDLDYRFTRGGEGLTEAATFRAYDAESPIASRPGLSRVSGELPPISRKIRLGEYQRLKQRNLPDGVRNAILADAERMTRAVAARLELARGDALVNGSVTISENGVIATVSFGRTGSHSVSAATPWSTVATATPLTDLLTWSATYEDTNGEPPGCILTSTRIVNYLLQNAQVRNLLAAGLVAAPSVVSRSALNTVLQSYGLPDIVVYNARVNVSGVSTRVIGDDKVLLLPAPVDPGSVDGTDLGATLYGTTVEAESSDFEIDQTALPGIVAGAYETKDPIALWTKAAAIALPVLANPDLSFVADVAA